jgi:hypothetical protein
VAGRGGAAFAESAQPIGICNTTPDMFGCLATKDSTSNQLELYGSKSSGVWTASRTANATPEMFGTSACASRNHNLGR